jgi:hypothetical protein
MTTVFGGTAPRLPVDTMGLSRKKSLQRLQKLEGVVLYHLDDHIPSTIREAPTAVDHWRKELHGFLNDMDGLTKHIGAKTAATWRVRINDLRLRVTDLLGDE